MKYDEPTERLIAECKQRGFNMWPMLAIFKKRSKINQDIPNEVISEICKEYLKMTRTLNADFPYFLKVLENKSREYFAKQQVAEHWKIKKEPMAFKDILKEILK